MPLAKPGLAATTLLTLILSWNEYLLAVILNHLKSADHADYGSRADQPGTRYLLVEYVGCYYCHDHPGGGYGICYYSVLSLKVYY